MPVIINEFEIVDRPAQGHSTDKGPSQETQQAAQPKPSCMTPHKIVSTLRHQKERLARVRAH
jgi:hypothetical protein